MSKKRLGRGLDALLSSTSKPAAESATAQLSEGSADTSVSQPLREDGRARDGDLRNLPVDQMYRGRYQPRRTFDSDALEELAASIRSQGVLQPVVVRARQGGSDGYEIIAGERRWRAAQLAGLAEIPAIIRDVPDDAVVAMALIENIQREDLGPLEEAQALARLRDEFELTQQEVADAVGKSRVAVTNLLRLLSVAPGVQRQLEAGELEMGHARALLSLEPIDQERLGREVARKGLSVRQTEALVRRHGPGRAGSVGKSGAGAASRSAGDADVRRLEIELSESMGAPVRIDHNARGKGQLVISYASMSELDSILSKLKGPAPRR